MEDFAIVLATWIALETRFSADYQVAVKACCNLSGAVTPLAISS
jgi:hypothetical protein